MTIACPVCRVPLGSCPHAYSRIDGIWRLIRPERAEAVAVFLRDYTRIRLAEGRGSDDPAFYRNLPHCPADHPIAAQWRLHRRTFECLRDRVLRHLTPGSEILDLGAGTGWLSNRLAHLGHRPCAVDISCDDRDGLGAARHFEAAWPRLQAEFDYLPFPDASFDAVVFNASLHYSSDYARTLGEAARVLRPRGSIVVLETPVYRSEASGRKMVEERHAAFLQRYGTRSDSAASIEYLTWKQLDGLAREMNIRWKIIFPWYGLAWSLRPWIAKIRRKREPSRFPILQATLTPAPSRQ